MKTPHVHATIIKAWADGAQIEVRVGGGGPWCPVCGSYPHWHPGDQYRVKPEPKPDVVLFGCIMMDHPGKARINTIGADERKLDSDTCMFVFDGETGKLKKAEVL